MRINWMSIVAVLMLAAIALLGGIGCGGDSDDGVTSLPTPSPGDIIVSDTIPQSVLDAQIMAEKALIAVTYIQNGVDPTLWDAGGTSDWWAHAEGWRYMMDPGFTVDNTAGWYLGTLNLDTLGNGKSTTLVFVVGGVGIHIVNNLTGAIQDIDHDYIAGTTLVDDIDLVGAHTVTSVPVLDWNSLAVGIVLP